MSSSKVVKSDIKNDQKIERYTLKAVQALKAVPKGAASPAPTPERQGYEKGFAAGERAGREAGVKQMTAAIQTVKRLVAEIAAVRDLYAKTIEKDVETLALAIARRILRQEISGRPEWLTDRIREAIQKLGETDALTIRLHPQDLERLRTNLPGAAELFDGSPRVLWETDATLHPGECVVSTQERIIDARIDSQLEIIHGKLERAIDEDTA